MNFTENIVLSKLPNSLSIHVPIADYNTKGISTFSQACFTVDNGVVKISNDCLKGIVNMQTERLKLNVVKSGQARMLQLLQDNVVLSEIVINIERKQ